MPRAIRITLTVAAAILALSALRSFWKQHEKAAGLDFYIYFVNSQLASRGDVENIYAPEVQVRIGEEYFERAQRGTSELRRYDATRRRRMDSVSSPFLYTSLRWVSRDYDFALRQYHVLVLASFVGGVVLLSRRAGISWAATFFLIAGLLQFYRGFEADLRVGNVNSIQLLMIAVAVWSPPFVAGAIFGALILFKPNLIYVAILLIAARRRVGREVAGGIAGAAIAFVMASINYGTPRVWLQWIEAANQFWHRLPARGERNVTPALSLFHEYGTWPSYAIAAVLLAIAAFVIWRRKESDDLLAIGLGLVIYLLSATVVWLHYMVLVLPLAIALLRSRWAAVVSIFALAAIAEEPFELLTGRPIYPNDAWLIGPALAALYVAGIGVVPALHRDPPSALRRLAGRVQHALLG
jgi:hypothetical protein